MQSDPASRRGAVEKALLDYHQSPGRFTLARRQPSLLYAAIKDVLQLASGRSPDGSGAPPSPTVRQAACFFIRSALLYPDADPYAVLGLERDAPAPSVKDHYRLMMRLMHPDFAAAMASAPWPADAATRVNRAYEILSSPERRAAYDEEMAPSAPAPAAQAEKHTSPGRLSAARGNAPARRRPEDNRRDLKRLSTVFGTVGGIALIAAGVASLQSGDESLVQRRDTAARQDETAARAKASPIVAARVADAPASPASQPEAAQDLVAAVEKLPGPPAAAPRTALVHTPTTLNAAAPAHAPAPAYTPTPSALMNAMLAAPPATPQAAQAAPVAAAPVPAAQVPAAPPSPTLADVHPILSRLLQEIESGWGDRVMALVDREARSAPAGQALLLHYNNLVGGTRPVKVSNVQFNAQPQGGRLLVTGHLTMQPYDRAGPPREFAVQAEFAARDGVVFMTRLTRAPD
ncbi:MAG: J domain-containing protein [Pseudomonadota bacterium]